ncbi:hypothetical protein Focb16_v006076 [Fusarium oxysporum f. sp. cubense]|uniref:Uncharacterized protein n=1 Tax=Fusarium oxysporum f. sp. cubense TaxID=61366 RepID=A0A559LMK0_FUSOC|nr:hypothetical protein Focb16_v006076 [Fusarium oxysporum f. sp. cubense]
MADQEIAEVMDLLSLLTQSDIKTAFISAFNKPSPRIKASTIGNAIRDLNTPEAKLEMMLMKKPVMTFEARVQAPQIQSLYQNPDGAQAGLVIDGVVWKPKLDRSCRSYHEYTIDSLLETDRFAQAKQKAEAIIEHANQIQKFTDKMEKLDVLIKAAESCGIPKSQADLLARNGKIETALKTALMRQAVKSAFINGTWQSAGLTAVFDFRQLLDGHFRQYLTNIGVSGLYGGSFGALSSWVEHPFFGNGLVLGVLVSSGFGTISLASTGDWARFGKGLGLNVASSAASWGGAYAGAWCGGGLGPIGAVVGGLVGGIGAGWAGRAAAEIYVPGLGGRTEYECRTMTQAMKRQLGSANLEHDPELTDSEAAELALAQGAGSKEGLPFNVRMKESMATGMMDMREVLLELHGTSPEAFEEFQKMLRAASS